VSLSGKPRSFPKLTAAEEGSRPLVIRAIFAFLDIFEIAAVFFSLRRAQVAVWSAASPSSWALNAWECELCFELANPTAKLTRMSQQALRAGHHWADIKQGGIS
jgi:hypothetical protein